MAPKPKKRKKQSKAKGKSYPINRIKDLDIKKLMKDHPLKKADKGRGRAILEKFTVEQIASIIADYFQDCIEKWRPLTMTGLANALDTDRETLLNYGKGKDALAVIIKKAQSIVIEYWESRLYGAQVTGAIFWLKNHEWNGDVGMGGIPFKVDKVEIIVKNGNIKDRSNSEATASVGVTAGQQDE